MKLMTIEEGKHWLRPLGMEPYQVGQFSIPGPITAYRLPTDSGAKTALAHLLSNQVFAEKSTVLILEETGIWESSENVFLFTKYREAVSSNSLASHKPFEDYPIHYAEAHEPIAMEGLIALSLYFIWGVLIFDGEGETFVRTSHDEWIEIGSTDQSKSSDAVDVLDDFGLVRL